MTWKKISSKQIFKHPRITLYEDIVELPNGQQVPYLTYGKHHDSAAVICIKDDQVLLQKEYAYPTGKELYQFPGGKVEFGEDPQSGALRELAEEAGLSSDEVTLLGWYYIDNRRTDAKQYIYLAKNCKEIEKPAGDIEEDITNHWTPIAKVDEMIRNGEVAHYSILSAWAMYKSL